jgi:O-antigen/teichoic acid export membrane protein
MRPRVTTIPRSAMYNFVGLALPLLVGVVTIPLIVHRMGEEEFGILAIAWVISTYLNIFDLGLGRATTRFVARAIGRDEADTIGTLIWTAIASQLVLGSAAAAVMAIAAKPLLHTVFEVPTNLERTAHVAFLVLAASIPFSLMTLSFRGALEAAQRFDLVNAVRGPLGSSNFLMPLVAVSLGWDLRGVVALLVVGQIGGTAAYFLMCLRTFPTFGSSARFDRVAWKTLIGYGSWISLSDFIGPILIYLDRLVLGATASVAAVGYYAAPFEIVSRLWIFPTSLVTALFPTFVTAEGSRARVASLTFRAARLLVLLVTPIAVLLIANGHDILQLWLGSDFANRSTHALQILGVGILANVAAYVPYSVLQAVGRADLPAKLYGIELPIHLVSVVLLTSQWGITGAATAWMLRVVLDAVLLYRAASRVVPLYRSDAAAEKLGSVAGLTAAAVAGALLIGLQSWSWYGTTMASASVALAFAVFSWRWVLTDDERATLRRALRPSKGR